MSTVKAFYNKLVAVGKKLMQAVVAVMRKLLHAIWGMLKYDQDFDGSKFFKIACPQAQKASNYYRLARFGAAISTEPSDATMSQCMPKASTTHGLTNSSCARYCGMSGRATP